MNVDHLIKNQCIIALDTQDEKKLDFILNAIDGKLEWVKVGMELYFSKGPKILEKLHSLGFKIFLDLKLHDIPQTVHNAILSLAQNPFDLLTIHLQGGSSMIKAAGDALKSKNHTAKLLGVSVLTSFDDSSWKKLHSYPTNIKESIKTLISQDGINQVHGIVCSGQEILDVKNASQLKTIVPGIRWNTSNQDQARVMMPALAFKTGADYLVIGREITQSPNIDESIKSLRNHLHECF